MNALFVSGIIVFAYVVGRAAYSCNLATGLRLPALTQHSLALVLGIALLTPPLVIVAWAGLFDVRWLGVIGWVGAAIGLWYRPPRFNGRQSVGPAEVVVLLAALVFAIVAASGRDETLGAGRDQQVYAESAIALSMRGSASASYTFLDDADRNLLRGLGGVRVLGLTRVDNGVDQPIRTTHPLGWPVWLALAHASLGVQGMYAANAAVYALGGLLLFALLRRLVAPGVAAAATCFFLALPSSLWIAGISLSEPLAMTLLLTVPLVGSAGLRRSRWAVAALLVAATFVRIDAALLVPASIAAATLTCVAASTPPAVTAARRFAAIQFVCLALVLLVYRTLFPGYLNSVLQQAVVIGVVSLALMASLALLTTRAAQWARRAIASPPVRLAAMAILVALFVYAATVRPTLHSYSIIHQASGLEGQRDFRELSLVDLAAYVSWPMLIFALAGVCYALHRNWAGRPGLFRPLVLLIGVGPTLLYLWAPHVSPDHPWAIRRFVPTVIPSVVIFGALFVHLLTRRLGSVSTATGAVALVVPYAAIASSYPPQQALVRENAGVSAQLAIIAKGLPNALVVDIGADESSASALFVAYGRPVAIVAANAANKATIERVTNWVRAKSRGGRPAWVLHDPRLWRTGAEIHDQSRWMIARRHLIPSARPPVTDVGTSHSELILSRIDRLDPSFSTRMFGGERVWGAQEAGFFDSEVAPFGRFRYTDGQAWIEVPSMAWRDAVALKVDVFSYAREGILRWLAVLVDGRPAWTGSVGPGVTTLRVPLAGVAASDLARIDILSESVDPADLNADDPRKDLGVGLIGIRPLRAGEPRRSGPGIQGFRSHLSLIGAPREPLLASAGHPNDFVLDMTNAGSEYWPTVRELGGPVEAVQVALRWYLRGRPGALVGDNRWGLSVSMLPGDRTRLRVPLVPTGLDGKTLPAGTYDVRVGMVRETVALFEDNGDAVLSVPVVVVP